MVLRKILIFHSEGTGNSVGRSLSRTEVDTRGIRHSDGTMVGEDDRGEGWGGSEPSSHR